MNKQELNMKAARMCGYDKAYKQTVCVTGEGLQPVVVMREDKMGMQVFNLDTSSADREATVVALIDNHGLSICGNDGSYFIWDERNQTHATDDEYDGYEEALYAAVEAAPEQEGV